ncbi:MAG: hypothetical protein AAB734_04645 [Patescibacteria group bacterium]
MDSMPKRLRGIENPLPPKQKPGEYVPRTSYDDRALPTLQARTEKMRLERLIITLVKELSESGESFPFPGMEPSERAKLEAVDEEFPGYTTPLKEFIPRCEMQGIRVVFSQNEKNIFIVPAGSDDTIVGDYAVSDGTRTGYPANRDDRFVNPRHLQVNEMMDHRLKRLIRLDKNGTRQ